MPIAVHAFLTAPEVALQYIPELVELLAFGQTLKVREEIKLESNFDHFEISVGYLSPSPKIPFFLSVSLSPALSMEYTCATTSVMISGDKR